MTKRRLKIRPVLITLNVALLIIIALFYTTRLIKYYLKENGHRPTNSTVLLVDELIKKQSYVDLTKGLIHDKDANIFSAIKTDVILSLLLILAIILLPNLQNHFDMLLN